MDIPLNPLYVALYPEIHYTFDLFFSRLRHSQPEILTDCPFRIDPGQPLPILFIIKHANRFPITLHSISGDILYEDGEREEHSLWTESLPVRSYLWHKVFHLRPREGFCGEALITARIQFERGGQLCTIFNHNYRGVGSSPLKVHLAREKLPAIENWYYGEPHCHSFHSDDQVEFGAPVPATAEMAQAMGLAWLAMTDHSYDLDDMYGNTLHYDHNLIKWKLLKQEIERSNAEGACQIILGEEISCGNTRNKNIHLLAYGIDTFIPGGGDGAERFFKTKPDLSLREALRRVRADGGIACAAHPEDHFTLGEQLLLRRGHWEAEDYDLPNLSGLQFWNGKQDKAFRDGYKRWVELLLSGRRLFFIGGNDAHGDFNIFRQIKIPLVKMIDSPYKVFGKVRTCLRCENGMSENAVLHALKNGNSIVSSGPFLTCSVEDERRRRTGVGGEVSGRSLQAEIMAKSTDEFGDIDRLTLLQGDLKRKVERTVEFCFGSHFHNPKDVAIANIALQMDGPTYIRAETTSRKGTEVYHAYTNPIWLRPA